MKLSKFTKASLEEKLKGWRKVKHSQLFMVWSGFLQPLQYGKERTGGNCSPLNNSWKGNNLFFLQSAVLKKCCPHLRYHVTSFAPVLMFLYVSIWRSIKWFYKRHIYWKSCHSCLSKKRKTKVMNIFSHYFFN